MIWTPVATDDGSFTFFSEAFGETFHSRQGARAEAFQKFASATQLAERARGPSLRLLDVCYGLGYNTAAALETIWSINPECQVEVYGLELDASVPLAALEPEVIAVWSSRVQKVLRAIAHDHQFITPTLHATLLIGDARQTIQQVTDSPFQADAIFFDPFSPRRCPQLWTVEFFRQVRQCCDRHGTLSTYSRSASVRAALLEAGFAIGTIPLGSHPLPHEWSQGTVAGLHPAALPPLSPMEQEHLQTRAAIPYRDPELGDRPETILHRHQQEQQHCQRESTSSWRRRWGIT